MPLKSRKARLEYQQARRDRLRKAGLCLLCGGPRDRKFASCSTCLEKSNKIVRKIIKRNLAAGLCQCGGTRAKEKSVCKKCSESSRSRQQQWKQQVIDGYGGRCACCKEAKREFLSVDHVKGDGAKLRRESGAKETSTSLYRKIVKLGFPKDYQILCYNCNLALAFYGYCPHRPRIKRLVIRMPIKKRKK